MEPALYKIISMESESYKFVKMEFYVTVRTEPAFYFLSRIKSEPHMSVKKKKTSTHVPPAPSLEKKGGELRRQQEVCLPTHLPD